MISEMAKTLIIIGVVLIGVGVCMFYVGKIPGVGKLPGDFYVKRESFTFYFPLTTCIILSIIFSIIFYLINHK